MAEPEGEVLSSVSEPEPEIEPEPEVEATAESILAAEGEYGAEFEPESGGSWPEGEAEAEAGAEDEPVWAEGEGAVSELGNDALMWSVVALYSLIIVLIVVLNLVVIIGVIKKSKLEGKINPINFYLLSLVVSRLCIGILVVPAYITGLFDERYLGVVLCKMCHFFALGSSATSVFSTTALSIVKYREIILYNGEIVIKTKRALLDILVIWIVGHSYAIRAPILSSLADGGRGYVTCDVLPSYAELDDYFMFVDLAVLFLLPLCIVVFCYYKVIKYLNVEHLLEVEKFRLGELSAEDAEKLKEDEKQKKRSINMILIVISLFFLCSIMPYMPQLYAFHDYRIFEDFAIWETSMHLISFSNPWINAIVILFFRDDLRHALKFLCTQKVEVEKRSRTLVQTSMTNLDMLLRTD